MLEANKNARLFPQYEYVTYSTVFSILQRLII